MESNKLTGNHVDMVGWALSFVFVGLHSHLPTRLFFDAPQFQLLEHSLDPVVVAIQFLTTENENNFVGKKHL